MVYMKIRKTLMHSFSHKSMLVADFFSSISWYVFFLVSYPSFLIHWSCFLAAKKNICSTSHQSAFKIILSIFRCFHFYSILQLLVESFLIASIVEFASTSTWNTYDSYTSPWAKSKGKRAQIMIIIPINGKFLFNFYSVALSSAIMNC